MRPLLVALLALPLLAPAQKSNVICPQEALWAFNSLYQSPCVVGAYLLGACEDDPTQVLVSKAIATARPGNGLPANACSCSSVTYSLLSVCAFCAGAAHPMLWTAWTSECNPDVVQLKALPYWVPPGTAVPTWAFLDITKGNAFDPTTAGTTASLGEPDVLPSAGAAGDSLPEPTPNNMQPISTTSADGRNNTRGSHHTDYPPESATEEHRTRTQTHSPFPHGSAHTTAPPRGGTAVPIVAGVLGALAGVAALSSGIAWIVRRRSSRFAAISGRPRRSSAHEKYRQQQQQQLAFSVSGHSHSRVNSHSHSHSHSHSRAQSLARNAAIPLTAKSEEAPAAAP